jgi:hypothetical protein
MASASRYWELVRIDATGRTKVETLDPVRTFFQEQFPQYVSREQIPDAQVHSKLFNQLKHPSGCTSTSDEALIPELCLRCFVSNAIEQVCTELAGQFGRQHGFTRYDLYPFVLDESTQLRRGQNGSANKVYRSLTSEVLQTFNPQQGSLTTWTSRLVRRHRELNAFLLECGVYLVSDWAILNDTTGRQVQRVFSEFFALTPMEIRQSCHLLESYHAVYRRDRLEQRQVGLKGRCLSPTLEQLQRIARHLLTVADPCGPKPAELSASEVLIHLQVLAERLRHYRIYVRSGSLPAESLPVDSLERIHANSTPTASGVEEGEAEATDAQTEFLTFYREQFVQCMDLAIDRVASVRLARLTRKNPLKVSQYLRALALFHCQGEAMNAIAPQIGLKAQYQVSRLLQLKEFRAEVRQHILLELRDRVLEKAQYYVDPVRLQQLDRTIKAALEDRVDEVFRTASAEASVSHNRPTDSLFARRLCRYLDARSPSL